MPNYVDFLFFPFPLQLSTLSSVSPGLCRKHGQLSCCCFPPGNSTSLSNLSLKDQTEIKWENGLDGKKLHGL